MDHAAQIAPLLDAITTLRTALRSVDNPALRASMRSSEVALRRIVGASVPKHPAAKALGISVTALDRWINLGALPVVAVQGRQRHGVETQPLIELLERVMSMRRAGHDGRVVAAAIRQQVPHLPGERRVIGEDVARLPRPNVSVADLVQHARTTTMSERLANAVALSRTLSELKLSTRMGASFD